MITLSVAQARIRRAGIQELAGDCFLSAEEILETIGHLDEFKEEQLLFGVYSSSSRWTVLTVRKLLFCFDEEPQALILNRDAEEIHRFYGTAGNKHAVDTVLLDGRKIWMKSVGLSSGIQNIVLMLQRLPDEVVLLP